MASPMEVDTWKPFASFLGSVQESGKLWNKEHHIKVNLEDL